MHSMIANWVKCGSNLKLIKRESLYLLSLKSFSSISYPVEKKNLRVCGSLYSQLKKTNKFYAESPNDGIEVNVEYADTHHVTNSKKVLVALHGMPGSHHDFAKLISYFAPNYRVLAPNFPSLELTRETRVYWGSAQEKAHFIRDFLCSLNVYTVDCLICHSAGAFPGSLLWSEPNDQLIVKSVALFNMGLPHKFSKIIRIFTKNLAKIVKNYGIETALKLRPDFIGSIIGYPTTGSDIDMLERSLGTFGVYLFLDNNLKYLHHNKIPTLFLMTEKDPVIKSKFYFDTIKVLNASDKNMSIFDGDKNNIQLISSASDPDPIHVINIRPGGHFAYSKHAHHVFPLLEKLIVNKVF